MKVKEFFAALVDLIKHTMLRIELRLHDIEQETHKYALLREIVESERCPVRPSIQHRWVTECMFEHTNVVANYSYCSKCGASLIPQGK